MNFSKLCTPALIYLVIAIIGIIMAVKRTGIMSGAVSIIFVLIWTWLLNFLCKKGYNVVSWILLFLPFISVLLVMMMGVKAGMMNY
jgi:uncharacterized membrane protein